MGIGIKGVVSYGKIALKEPLTLPEGMEVEIIPPTKFRLLKHAGIWKDRKDIDIIIKEIYDSRIISSREVKF